MHRPVIFKFEVGNMTECDAHGGGFRAALGVESVGIVYAAPSVALVQLVHGLLQLYSPRVLFLGEEGGGVCGEVLKLGQGDPDFGGIGCVRGVVFPEAIQ